MISNARRIWSRTPFRSNSPLTVEPAMVRAYSAAMVRKLCMQNPAQGDKPRMKLSKAAWTRSVIAPGALALLFMIVTIVGIAATRAQTANPQGDGRLAIAGLRGIIVTTNHEPVTNATVTIEDVLAGRGAIYTPDAPDVHRQAGTGPDGRFEFTNLIARTKFSGVVLAPGYEPQYFRAVGLTEGPVEIKLLPAPIENGPLKMVRGRVVSSDGRPIERAAVQAVMIHDQARISNAGARGVYTDSDGQFVIRQADDFIACDLVIWAAGYISQKHDEVPTGEKINEYRMERGAVITGRLMKAGKPVRDAGVGLCGTRDTYLENFSAVTGDDGRFSFSGLPSNERFYLFGIMRSLRELGALPRKLVTTGGDGTRTDVGDLNLVEGYVISGRIQMMDGSPTWVPAFTLSRVQLNELAGHVPTKREKGNPTFYGLETDFDLWEVHVGKDGKFAFTGVPGETVSLNLKLKPFDTLSPRNISSDGRGFTLLGSVVSNQTDLIIELEPHQGQVFPPRRDVEALSHQPLQGAERAKKDG